MAGALGITLAGPRQLLPVPESRTAGAGGRTSDTWVGEREGRSAVTRADPVRALYLYGVGRLLVFLAVVSLITISFAAP